MQIYSISFCGVEWKDIEPKLPKDYVLLDRRKTWVIIASDQLWDKLQEQLPDTVVGVNMQKEYKEMLDGKRSKYIESKPNGGSTSIGKR